jgi:RNA polymerase sigma-70 factor, ECF subfamily
MSDFDGERPDRASHRATDRVSGQASNRALQSVAAPIRAELDDGDLVGLVARGDTAAFETVYDRHVSAVYGMVRQVLRDPAQSEEVTQEVLVEAWRTAARFDVQRGSVRAWLITMARRRAIDRVRAVQAAGAREVRAASANHAPDFDHVSETVETRLEQERVRRCLGALTQLQRESIELAYYGGYSQREVSDLLGMPLGTVKTRLRDGLIRLRDCIGVA